MVIEISRIFQIIKTMREYLQIKHRIFFCVNAPGLFERYTCKSFLFKINTLAFALKKSAYHVDHGALTTPQGGTLYQARSDFLQTILAIAQQFIHRLANVFCHFINKQRWWSFSDYSGKNNKLSALALQYGIHQHLAHQEPHAFLFAMKPGWLVFHRKKYGIASGIKSRDLYRIFDKLIGNCCNRHC